jgi:hypothetical protein
MEYLIDNTMQKYNISMCKNFIKNNQELINDAFLNNIPNTINEMKNTENMNDILLNWKYKCFSDKTLKLIVLKDDIIQKNDYLFKFSINVNDKQLKYIELQLNFMMMKFNDFIEYIYQNKDYYKNVKLEQFKKSKKPYKLNIYITVKDIKNIKNILFESKNFYELIEGSKLFLHKNNYIAFEQQTSHVYGVNIRKTIQTFFRLRLLKIFLYKNYSLFRQEKIFIGGSFLLFSMGFRISKDTDIYIIEKEKNQKLDLLKQCNFDFFYNEDNNNNKSFKILNNMFNISSKYNCLFGFKCTLYKNEIGLRIYKNSNKALADLIILLYYFKEKININLNINDISKILYYKYNDYNIDLIKKYFKYLKK